MSDDPGSAPEDRRKIPDRRKQWIDRFYRECIALGILPERRGKERRKDERPADRTPQDSSAESLSYQQLLRTQRPGDARSSIVGAAARRLQEAISPLGILQSRGAHPERGRLPFVTISRETGTGGHSLAETLLKELEKNAGAPLFRGWQMIDKEICQEVMEDPRLKVTLEMLQNEQFFSGMDDFLRQAFIGTSPCLAVYHKIFGVIRSFALAGKAVIVGRAGSLLTRDLPCGVHVRLIAGEKARLERLMRHWHLAKEEARRRMLEMDAARRRLVRTCFHREIDYPLLYDAVFNTDSVPIPQIAGLLLQMIQRKHDMVEGVAPRMLTK